MPKASKSTPHCQNPLETRLNALARALLRRHVQVFNPTHINKEPILENYCAVKLTLSWAAAFILATKPMVANEILAGTARHASNKKPLLSRQLKAA
jgi:hypothetical protein